MVKKKRGNWAALSLVVTLAFVVASALGVRVARATEAGDLRIAGCDYLIPSAGRSANDDVDILTVTGKKGDTVYINMADGKNTIASHLAFTLDDNNAQADANGDMVGVVSLTFNSRAFSYRDTYAIDVFADRAETDKLYSGTVSTSFAKCGEALTPVVVRTLAKDEARPFAMPEMLTHGSMMYSLANAEPQEVDGLTVYQYEESKDAPAAVDGHVSYFDSEDPKGLPLRTDEISQIARGESREVVVPDVISTDDGTLYRTLQLSGNVTAAYPGPTEFSVMCQRLDGDWGKEGSFFTARIQYVNAQGEKLELLDSVLVNKRYLYTPPTYIYISGEGGAVQEYRLSASNPGLSAEGVLVLEPGMAEGTADFDIAYEPVADDEERTWTVVLENGSVDPTDPARVIDRVTYRGRPGERVTHETKKKIVVDGVDYVPVNTAQEAYEHTFAAASMDIEQVIYYVPDGYTPPAAYEVTVNYVNIATNEVIDTQSYTASPDMRRDLEIESPESFSKGGVEWVRLAGQEMAIRHSFYAGRRTYVVYYRDINDDLHATTVINTVNITYTDEEGNTVTRPTTVTDDGNTVNYTENEVDGTTTYTGRTTENTDGGTTYTDGGTTTTTTDGGTTTTNGGTRTTTTDGGTTTTDGGTTTVNGGTRTTAPNGGTTVTNGGTRTTGTGTTARDGGTTTAPTTDGGATNAGAGNAGTTGGNAAGAGNGATTTGLQTGRNMYSISGSADKSGTLVGQDGRDMATMRIDDDATPLAGPDAGAAAGAANGKLSGAAVTGGSLAALAALAAVLFFVYKRRKKDEEDSSDNNVSV